MALRFLDAHHRSRAATRHGPLTVVHDGGDAAQVLACRADTEHITLVIILAQLLGEGENPHSPQLAGIVKGDDIVFDLDPDRLFGSSTHDHHIVAGLFELHTPKTAGVRIQHGSRQRAFGSHRETVAGLVAGGGQADHW